MVRGGSGRGEGHRTKEKLHVPKLKWLSVTSSSGVLAGAQQKEKTEADHVGASEGKRVLGQDGLGHDMLQNGNRDGLDPRRRVVLFGEAGKHALQAEIQGALWGESRIRGPHTGKRLANAAYGALHGAAADGTVAGIDGAGAVAVSEDLEERDRVFDVVKGRID